ncbi:hypothetical protein KL930_002592 [Ogataea haglerorum]|nr:hypothetical protein KL951_002715 [Ogataea haglerorum]KAG7778505.1 hypothetical protein KL930_002592 [Ogataea haglerorum]KAG7779191.1 hypothetical protein KL922_001676 [Ogataea haglerorum]
MNWLPSILLIAELAVKHKGEAYNSIVCNLEDLSYLKPIPEYGKVVFLANVWSDILLFGEDLNLNYLERGAEFEIFEQGRGNGWTHLKGEQLIQNLD